MANEKKKLLRLHFLIYPAFQLRIIAVGLIGTLGGVAFTWLAASRAISQIETVGEQMRLGDHHFFFKMLESQQSILTQQVAIAAIILVAIIILGALVFSHRLAGPIYRIHKDVKESNLPIKIRDGDYLQDFVVDLNEALKK
jgi:hypothetical protein